jgi:enoyl-CoA hydratase/carnithine racemase
VPALTSLSRVARSTGDAAANGDAVVRDRGGIIALRIYASLKPMIGAVNGAAIGLGATITLPMDMRLASERSRYGFVFARLGIVPEAASSWFLPRVVGISRAMEWCATGRLVEPGEAYASGLVRSVHSPADLLPAARALAAEIAQNTAPVSVALTRRLLWRMLGESQPLTAHRIDSRAVASRRASADATEGVTSFHEKRGPRFTDRVSDGLPDIWVAEDRPGW